MLGPLSPLKKVLHHLTLVDIGSSLEARAFVFELWQFGCLFPAYEEEIEALQEVDATVVDFPRDAGHEWPTPFFSDLASRDFDALLLLRPQVGEDRLCTIDLTLSATPTPYSWTTLSSLDLTVAHTQDDWPTIELVVIFGTTSFPQLKRLKLSGSLNYSIWAGGLSRGDHFALLCSVSP